MNSKTFSRILRNNNASRCLNYVKTSENVYADMAGNNPLMGPSVENSDGLTMEIIGDYQCYDGNGNTVDLSAVQQGLTLTGYCPDYDGCTLILHFFDEDAAEEIARLRDTEDERRAAIAKLMDEGFSQEDAEMCFDCIEDDKRDARIDHVQTVYVGGTFVAVIASDDEKSVDRIRRYKLKRGCGMHILETENGMKLQETYLKSNSTKRTVKLYA